MSKFLDKGETKMKSASFVKWLMVAVFSLSALAGCYIHHERDDYYRRDRDRYYHHDRDDWHHDDMHYRD